VIVAYRPRRYARLWPLLIVAVIITRIAAPHSISALKYQFTALGSSNSTSGRTADYPAVAPFINSHLLFGRGFGSYDPHKYRILDDQMLGFLIEIGAFGILAYVAMILAPVHATWRRARRGLTVDDDLLAGMAAGCVAFLVSNVLYDSFDFRQGPYVFFFLAALAAAAVGRRGSQAVEPEAPAAVDRPPPAQNGAVPAGNGAAPVGAHMIS
jgi:polysaccharide biosynthesis protein PslJ